MENINEIVSMASNVGMCVVITAYFLIRDWKFQGTIIEALGKLAAVTEQINQTIARLHREDV